MPRARAPRISTGMDTPRRSLAPAIVVLSLLVASFAFPTHAAAQAPRAPTLDPLFRDHAVLQRDRALTVRGTAAPLARVSVRFAGRRASAVADGAGRWAAALPALSAGGPYRLEARTSAGTATAEDVLVGDVWLCSGQSNMELAVAWTNDAAAEIARATNPRIHLLTVAHAASPEPLAAFATEPVWRAAVPATVRDFSAVCWYFARELQHTVDVPMGLIHASWGGSNIETWIGADVLRAVGGFDAPLDLLRLYMRDADSANQRFGAAWQEWWRAHAPPAPEPWDAADWRAVPALRDWKTWGVSELARHDGMVWYRQTVQLTAAEAARPATLALGGIDEVDETWVNGRVIGTTFGWGTERRYRLPAGTLQAGENVIVVNVLSTWGAGGMTGPAEHMGLEFGDGTAVPLGGEAGGWTYRMVPESVGSPPRAPWESLGGLTTLHNGMIAPLDDFGLRGVLWYQGESNAGAPGNYQALLAGLMADWRRRFGAGLPFLVVQLPNFGAVPTGPVESGWAEIREAQRRAVAADAHAGLAVTIDVGDPGNLHPPNKQAVGSRLARAARRVVYGERIAPSGPVPVAARRDGSRVVVSFRDVEGRLVAAQLDRVGGFEVCGPERGSCRAASALVSGDSAVLEVAPGGPPPVRVRFCWGDAPVCNVRDGSGLPVGPFELAIGAAGAARTAAPAPAAAAPSAAPAPPPGSPLEALSFLVGDWVGGGGGSIFEWVAERHALVRRNWAVTPDGRHEDVLLVYPGDGGALRALYVDNEGHTIPYDVAVAPDRRRVVFLSTGGGPRYRLWYEAVADGSLAAGFEVAPPGSTEFRTYLAWTARRR